MGEPPRDGTACVAAPNRSADSGTRCSWGATGALAALGLRAMPAFELCHHHRHRWPTTTDTTAAGQDRAAAHAHHASPLGPARCLQRQQGLDGAGRSSPCAEIGLCTALGAYTPARTPAVVAARVSGGGSGARGAIANGGFAGSAPRASASMVAVARECGALDACCRAGTSGGARACCSRFARVGRHRGGASRRVASPRGARATIGTRAVAAQHGARGATPRADPASSGAPALRPILGLLLLADPY